MRETPEHAVTSCVCPSRPAAPLTTAYGWRGSPGGKGVHSSPVVPKWDTPVAADVKNAIESNLPAIIERRRPGWSTRPRIATDPGFVSQLIAERDHLPAQRQRRRAPLGDAIAAYHQGERRDVRRLPQGFFRSAEA